MACKSLKGEYIGAHTGSLHEQAADPNNEYKETTNMARLFGIEIPNEKRVEASLRYIYGIGASTAKKVLEQAGVSPDLRTGTLSDAQLTKIVQAITSNNILIEGDLRREKQMALKRLTSINCLRGIRHRKGLPVRGQRTRTNARTRKGRKKTVGAKKS